MSSKTLVMDGNFDSFSLHEVLEVVGLSRQLMQIIFRTGADVVGHIVMKAGRVLRVEARNSGPGMPAFVTLMHAAPERFEVLQLPPERTQPRPLGTLIELLERSRQAPTPVTEVAPRPKVIVQTTEDSPTIAMDRRQAGLEPALPRSSPPPPPNRSLGRTDDQLTTLAEAVARLQNEFRDAQDRQAARFREVMTELRAAAALQQPTPPADPLQQGAFVELLGRMVAAQQSSRAEWTVLLVVMVLQVICLFLVAAALGLFK